MFFVTVFVNQVEWPKADSEKKIHVDWLVSIGLLIVSYRYYNIFCACLLQKVLVQANYFSNE